MKVINVHFESNNCEYALIIKDDERAQEAAHLIEEINQIRLNDGEATEFCDISQRLADNNIECCWLDDLEQIDVSIMAGGK